MTDSIAFTRTVAADLPTVWRAWTTPEGLAAWWWPQLPDTTYRIDARPGGTYHFESKAAGIGARGEFLTVEEPTLLEMTWWWLGGEGTQEVADVVRVRLTRDGDGVRVDLEHELRDGVATGSPSDGLRQGWTDVLDRLARL
ncbi:SRPBCC domain-containing protein [Calidifontibacter sp. DB0510]|uniref:SRPBCC domain-containing protein n=1 Tax=Metallococcus carri TaxID=1656884 RepID=A0A967B467_9MICO|nr:SRPBCC domain-containing protein [Metallococcus carri]NHN54281.1 SRPBCC domain-containing protein [Metallococcus carri]NOP36879.1 SRPBCC domain-containing protein [Calidifontibacter sp. DB2511S]